MIIDHFVAESVLGYFRVMQLYNEYTICDYYVFTLSSLLPYSNQE